MGYNDVNEFPEVEYIKCPFCGEDDFDFVGLKTHLAHDDCEVYNNTEINKRIT